MKKTRASSSAQRGHGARLSGTTAAPLASAVAAWLTLSAPVAHANIVYVTNCDDSGGGSLRQSVSPGGANSGDTVDLTGLPATCSGVISLTTGEVTITQADLTLHGPPAGVTVKYNGAGHARVLRHTGTGTLRLENLTLAKGYAYSMSARVRGGCLYSSGNVYLWKSKVANCKAVTKGQFESGQGGGVFAAGTLTLQDAVISGNTAQPFSAGGGVYAGGDMTIVNSSITANSAKGDAAGGGVCSFGHAVVVEYSTVSGNYSGSNGGGIAVTGGSLIISNSTISGNSTGVSGGAGVSAYDAGVSVLNSTIAFNTGSVGKSGSDYLAPGLTVATFTKSVTVTLQSSILANNTYGTTEDDFSTSPHNSHPIFTVGADNLIRTAFTALPPSGLITGACPRLGRLRNNGGATLTHALLSHSVAIDAGNNDSFLPGKVQYATHDQRGLTYARTSGPTGSPTPGTDIGAYEVQQGDIVFDTDFEGCP